MKIFIAGASGVIGRSIVPRLLKAGHEVSTITRSETGAERLKATGVNAVVGDVFEPARVSNIMASVRPEVVIHQLTSLPARIDPRKVNQSLAQTNKLRSEGTRILMDAALAAGARQFIAQSISSYYAPTSVEPAGEDEPLYHSAPDAFVGIVQALAQMEHTVLKSPGIDGIILRYGYFYGPGTAYAPGGTFAEDVSRRRVPIIGGGGGIFSFVHVEDAAAATVLAMQQGRPGIYNIVDDDPAPLSVWLPIYARLLNAPRPMRLPKFIGRLAAGQFGVYFMTEQRGASNQKARQQLRWQPGYASWRDGFLAEFTTQPQPEAGQPHLAV